MTMSVYLAFLMTYPVILSNEYKNTTIIPIHVTMKCEKRLLKNKQGNGNSSFKNFFNKRFVWIIFCSYFCVE